MTPIPTPTMYYEPTAKDGGWGWIIWEWSLEGDNQVTRYFSHKAFPTKALALEDCRRFIKRNDLNAEIP